MKKTAIATCVAAALAISSPAFADVAEELAAMKARIAQLESQLATQQATIAKQGTTSNTSGGFADNVSVSGALEVLATHSEEDGGNSTNDVLLDTFELGIEAKVNENVTLSSLIEYDSDAEKLDVTEAYAVIGAPDSNLSLTVGKAPVPFAVINSNSWTDPLTDDAFDIKEGMAMVSWGNDSLTLDAYTFNGAEDGDTLDTIGLGADFAVTEGLSFGAGYLSDVADLNGLPAGDAWRVNGLYEVGALALSAEYIDIDADNTSIDPTFLHLNAGYATNVFGADGQIFAGYSETDDGQNVVDLAEERIVLGVERSFGENASVVAEYVREESYSNEETDTLNLVLVTEF
ncbi:LbtU family siderophore porin [Neptuniibacter sp. 2_MG-2023]|uniref:LbtU family siderophore porin n=1 Tax=Neptuniibacter sp. 2_MG-2023 TaxID=3062671 RepID=UPI0026E38B49|nr:LbtU family siderophore porin [Neptuniibacter sp. 2_MG-2023]MDO6514079.1 LbtU family siderophore porin [Neptuniibacter sp. 2_MG-2023]